MTSHCCTPRGVVPAAKYQCGADWVAHGVVSSAPAPSIPSSTTIRPPNVSTVSAPGPPSWSRVFVTTVLAATVSGTWVACPLSARSVTTTSAATSPTFAKVTRPSACGKTGGSPGQNQAVLASVSTAALGATLTAAGPDVDSLDPVPATSAPTSNAPRTTTKSRRRDL